MSTPIIIYAAMLLISAWTVNPSKWEHKATTSASIRNPHQEFMVVDGDTSKTPTDFELRWGVSQTRTFWKEEHELTYEREDGRKYWGHHNLIERNSDRFVFGIEEDYDVMYTLNAYSEIKVGILGVGISRNYIKRWTEDGATMFRMGIRSKQEVGVVTVQTTATYETNGDRTNMFLRWDALGIKAGNVEFIPFFQWKRTGVGDGTYTDRWQGKLMVAVAF